MPGYQELKLILLDAVPLSRDGFHIYIGFIAFLAALAVVRRPLRSFALLLPGLAVAVLMEAFDASYDLGMLGRVQWAESLRDVLNTNLIPLLLVLLARAGALARGAKKKPAGNRRG